MKLCLKCNSSNQDFDTVCINCGSPLDSSNGSGTYDTNTGMDFDSPSFSGTDPTMLVKTNGMAIASLVLGIVGVLLSCCCYIGLIPAILAIIFGIISKAEIKKSLGNQKGDGMALAGIILGGLVLLVTIGLIILAMVIGGTTSSYQFWEEFIRQIEQNNGVSGQY